jgi:uncharacterized protein YcfL
LADELQRCRAYGAEISNTSSGQRTLDRNSRREYFSNVKRDKLQNPLHFMRTSCVIIFALLLVGCTSTRQNAPLTAEQAKTVAMRLANNKAFTLYDCQPFRDSQPVRFVAGHWIWVEQQGFGNSDIQATVQLAADGSTHNVDLQLLNSQNLIF